MGLEEAEKIWDALVEYYGDRLAHPDHEPKRFAAQCKLYKYMIGQKPLTIIPKGNKDEH